MSVALEVCRIAEEQLGIEALPRVTGMGLEVGNRMPLKPMPEV